MPIRPEHRHFYPIDWRELSHEIRFVRARGRCERCERPHGKTVVHLGDGRWFDEARGRWRDDRGRLVRERLPEPSQFADGTLLGRTIVHLACAHLDQDTANNAGTNLAALASAAISITTGPGTSASDASRCCCVARSATSSPDPMSGRGGGCVETRLERSPLERYS